MGCGHIPTEAEQYDMYVKVASAVKGKDISIRVFDIGGDKEIDWLDCNEIVSNDRGIRYCLNHIDIFKNQLRAILRVSGIYSNIKILLPFVSSIEEIYETKAIIRTLMDELTLKGFPVNKNIEIGAMIETPATVFIMDLLAKEVNFFSVGTNDLIHSLLVSDRYSGKMESSLLPPSVLRCIYYVIKQAHKQNKPVALCGEVASNPNLIPIWLSFGFTIFSVSPSLVLKAKKAVCQTIDVNKAIKVQEIFDCTTAEEVDRLINES